MPREFIPPDTCPVCGEAVPPGARACPACGADERSGWDEDATRYDDLDLPDAVFSDEAKPAPRQRPACSKIWIGVTAALLVLFLLSLILH